MSRKAERKPCLFWTRDVRLESALRVRIHRILVKNCTGCDDHDSPFCYKCHSMKNELIRNVMRIVREARRKP